MGKRREGREAAVQFLYQLDLNRTPAEDLLPAFWRLREKTETPKRDQAVRVFAEALVQGVIKHRQEIDGWIQRYLQNFDFNRLAVVDRNIMRVAVYEMLHAPETPPVVSINEALEIARAYGTDESRRFVNGVLDRIRKEVPRPAREALVSKEKGGEDAGSEPPKESGPAVRNGEDRLTQNP